MQSCASISHGQQHGKIELEGRDKQAGLGGLLLVRQSVKDGSSGGAVGWV